LLDRIDRQQRRLQFALLPGTEPKANTGAPNRGLRSGRSETKKARAKEKTRDKKASGKAKKRQRKKR